MPGASRLAPAALGRYLWEREESLARRLGLAPLVPLAWLYGLGAWLHRGSYRWRTPTRLPARVISIGNLTVGGSGKTPTVAWLAAGLRDRGRRVAILSRGVGGRLADRVNVVSDGSRLHLGARDVGDEPVWLGRSVPGVAVLAGRNRVALGMRAASALGAEILILDDGFQHHRLHRDLDLVCVDAKLGLGNGYMLPRGPLREPARALRRADALIVTRAPGPNDSAVHEARKVAGASTPVFTLRMQATGLRCGGSGELRSLDTLRGARLGVLTAIARPDRLCRDLEQHGASVVELRAFPDHHLYRRVDLEGRRGDLRWVSTAKDVVKIPPEWTEHRALEVIEEAVCELGEPGLPDWVLAQLDARRSASSETE